MTFKVWLEQSVRQRYVAVSKEIIQYVDEMSQNLAGEIEGEELFRKVLHAFADDILSIGDSTLSKQLVTDVKQLCYKTVKPVGVF